VKADRLVALVLVAAIAGLGGTAAWAVVKASGTHSTTNYYGSMMGSGGMIGYRPGSLGVGVGTRVTGLPEAKRLAQDFADRLGLKVDEVLQFQRNYYAKLVDRSGRGATEVLVDPQTGAVSLEYGPAMMWNTRYGMHGSSGMMGSYGTGMMGGSYGGGMMSGGGMMGGSFGAGMMGGSYGAPPPATGTAGVSIDRARQLGRRWLDANRSGLQIEPGGDAFPGYYTFEVLRQGKIEGMLSVNATTGAVLYHWWHGAFVAELK
jgi:hypothetical protein